MKKLLLALFALSMIATGCGKNNKATNNQTQQQAEGLNGQYDSNSIKGHLNSLIDNNNFSPATGLYGSSVRIEKKSFTYECKRKNGWFGIDYTSCSADAKFESNVQATSINVDQKKAELKGIVNELVDYRISGNVIEILTSSGKNVTLSFNHSIQANPVYYYDYQAKSGYFTITQPY